MNTPSPSKNCIPWVEKYRPTNFDNIVLDPINRTLFQNILDNKYFPNLLLYGPPGTGKTTTIINLIHAYQQRYCPSILSPSSLTNDSTTISKNKGSIIHLNASDERGIEIIRNQIYQFVKSKNLFDVGLKFVILDEVDYMTKNAQQALKYILQSSSSYNVRFCLICNYISKIDESLKNEFICIRFNQLPKEDIYKFVDNITKNENLTLSKDVIYTIQELYKSDIRSIINFIQLNQNIIEWQKYIITDTIWEKLWTSQKEKEAKEQIKRYIYDIGIQYNMDGKNIIKNYLNYIICNKTDHITHRFLEFVEIIIHSNDVDNGVLLDYFIENFDEET
jgi:replication factor C subunit 3/5